MTTQDNRVSSKILTPTLSVSVAFGCLIAWLVLIKVTPIFITLFKGLEVELPFPTKFLLTNYFWIYPLFFGLSVAALVAQEIFVRDARRRLLAMGAIFLTAAVSVGAAVICLYLPLFVLAEKLNRK
jgi:type II secretory pathway component PulF